MVFVFTIDFVGELMSVLTIERRKLNRHQLRDHEQYYAFMMMNVYSISPCTPANRPMFDKVYCATVSMREIPINTIVIHVKGGVVVAANIVIDDIYCVNMIHRFLHAHINLFYDHLVDLYTEVKDI
jgi:hypothetical protein